MLRDGIVVSVLSLAVAFAAGGCLQAQYTEIGPQSHFDYPNSNVKALNPVKIKTTGHSQWFGMALPVSDDHVKAYNLAISKVQGANMVIDYVKVIKIYSFPLLPLSWNEIQLDGTAAKMEIGRQELKP